MGYAEGHPVRLVGGRLALDFLNTADWTAGGHVCHEKLTSLDDLRVWADTVGLRESALPRTLRAAIDLRRQLRPLFVPDLPREAGRSTSTPSLPLGAADAIVQVRAHPVLSLVVLSAAALLADPRESCRIKLCPGHDCGWLFLDETRNERRRWCMMETCGNRAKAARHYSRQRSQRAAS